MLPHASSVWCASLLVGVAVTGATSAGRLDVPPTTRVSADSTRCGSAPFVIRQVRLFDGDTLRDSMDVYVATDRITAVGRNLRVPAGTTECSGARQTLLPGLIDAHAHVNTTDDLAGALRFGVTTVLDQFSDTVQVLRPLRATGLADSATGLADLRTSGTIVTSPGGHGTEYGLKIPTLSRPEDASAFIAARINEGSDYIKIAYDNGAEWRLPIPTLDSATLRAAIVAAKEQNRLSVVHIGARALAEQVVRMRPNVIAHVPGDTAPQPGFGKRMKDGGVYSTPTIAAIVGLSTSKISVRYAEDWPWLQGVMDRRQLGFLTDSAWRPPVLAGVTAVEGTVEDIIANNVPILAGTDAPLPAVPFGIGLHYELRYLAMLGLRGLELLRSATSRTADAYSLPDRGRVRPGLRADLLLLQDQRNPEALNTLRIAAVWKRGRRVQRAMPRMDTADSILTWGMHLMQPMSVRECFEVGAEGRAAAPRNGWSLYRPPTLSERNQTCSGLQLLRDNETPAPTYRLGTVVRMRADITAADSIATTGATYRLPPPVHVASGALPSLLWVEVKGQTGGGRFTLQLVDSAGTVLRTQPVTVLPDAWTVATMSYGGLSPASLATRTTVRFLVSGPAGTRSTIAFRNIAEY